MKIIVTGATGFLGTKLCKRLEADGHKITRLNSKNCDLTDQNNLNKFIDQTYDQIYHLAAWTQAGDFCLYHPGEQWIINQQINTNILTWWHRHQAQAKLVTIGTSCAYAPNMLHAEENYLIGEPIDSLYTYAMTKRMLYVGLKAMNKQYGLNYLVLVPSTLYGPGYHTDGRQMHFIFDLIRKIIRLKLYDEKVILWGDGYQRRELIYIDDFVDLAIQIVDQRENDLINIGAGQDYSIREFAQMISEKVGIEFEEIEFDLDRYVGARSKLLDVRKLQKMIPDYQFTSLDEGLENTLAWFWEEQDEILNA